MSDWAWRKCKICGSRIHKGGQCDECIRKADPWGSVQEHIRGDIDKGKRITAMVKAKAEFDRAFHEAHQTT